MRRLGAAALLVVLVATGCAPGSREAEPFTGIWASRGWGTFLLVQGGDVEIFEHSAIHCLSVVTGGARGIADVLSLEGDTLLMRDSDREVRFDRIDVLPPLCADASPSPDPVRALGVLGETVAEQYVGTLDPGWSERQASLSAEVAAGGDLSAALRDLIGPLDGAVRFATTDGEVWPPQPVLDPAPGTTVGVSGGFAVGEVGDGIGYLALARPGPFDSDGAESERILAANVDRSLDGPSMVLDLRRSDGGVLGHVLLALTRFVPSESVVARLEARDGDGFVPAGDLVVTPVPTGVYDGSVYVLIGPETRGVGELLAWVLGEQPRVTLIGAPTAGSPAPPLVRYLPNGWSAAIPNLRVVAPDGSIVGAVEPDVVSDDPLRTALELAG